jgi:hypothetical protein
LPLSDAHASPKISFKIIPHEPFDINITNYSNAWFCQNLNESQTLNRFLLDDIDSEYSIPTKAQKKVKVNTRSETTSNDCQKNSAQQVIQNDSPLKDAISALEQIFSYEDKTNISIPLQRLNSNELEKFFDCLQNMASHEKITIETLGAFLKNELSDALKENLLKLKKFDLKFKPAKTLNEKKIEIPHWLYSFYLKATIPDFDKRLEAMKIVMEIKESIQDPKNDFTNEISKLDQIRSSENILNLLKNCDLVLKHMKDPGPSQKGFKLETLENIIKYETVKEPKQKLTKVIALNTKINLKLLGEELKILSNMPNFKSTESIRIEIENFQKSKIFSESNHSEPMKNFIKSSLEQIKEPLEKIKNQLQEFQNQEIMLKEYFVVKDISDIQKYLMPFITQILEELKNTNKATK